MLSLEEIEPGVSVTHKNTGLRYAVGALADDEVAGAPAEVRGRPPGPK